MRKEIRERTSRTAVTQHAPHCTCSPIRWAAPVLHDVDPLDLSCPALASVPRPRQSRQVSTWDWSRSGSRRQRPKAA